MRIDAAKLRGDISNVLRRVLQTIRTGNIIAESLLVDARLHVQARYPGSQHWDPSNISISETTEDSGSIDIDIPGATRAYHDVEILPRWRQHLTIPLHPMAKGKKAEDIDGLFRPRNKNILAKVIDGQLVPIFALVKRAFQHQDTTLLPSDDTFADNIQNRWVRAFFNQLDNLQSNGNVV